MYRWLRDFSGAQEVHHRAEKFGKDGGLSYFVRTMHEPVGLQLLWNTMTPIPSIKPTLQQNSNKVGCVPSTAIPPHT